MNTPMKRFAMIVFATALPVFAFAQSTPPSAPQPMPQAMPTLGATASTLPVADITMRRASRIIGANITNEENRNIGEVQDLMITQAGGPITAVISVGGFLGMGERYVSVPLSSLRWNTENSRWSLPGATVDSLKARPVYTFPERS